MFLSLLFYISLVCSGIESKATPTPQTWPSTLAIPDPITRSCYHCYIHKKSDTTDIYANTTLPPYISVPSSDNALDHCQVSDCTGSCALATSTITPLPANLQYPTEMPYYATTGIVPASTADTIELEYRVCVASPFDLCSSFPELQSDNCRQEKCLADLCNKEFSDPSKTLIIIVVVGVLLVVLVCSAGLFGYWYFKIRTPRQYTGVDDKPVEGKPVSMRRSIKKSFLNKTGFVKFRVSEIENEEQEGSVPKPLTPTEKSPPVFQQIELI